MPRTERIFYLDPVTGAYGRRYLEDQQPELEKAEALAVIDIDNLKEINDGRIRPPLRATRCCGTLRTSFSRASTPADTLVRYGGDNLCCCCRISRRRNSVRYRTHSGTVYTTEIPQYENIHPTVSIGGVSGASAGRIRRADKLMYWAKQKRNDVQT